MKITVIGAGYVGLVTAACFAKLGHQVTCVETNEERLRKLRVDLSPFYEPGLQELLPLVQFTDIFKPADIVFIAVGTPNDENGATNLSALWGVVESLAAHQPPIVVIKSTVPVGTCAKIAVRLPSSVIISNPEFLREGTAIQDFLEPDRIVIGLKNEAGRDAMGSLYADIYGDICWVSWESAELSKYASNAMLATRVSFINEIANFCSVTGANIKDIEDIVGSDHRIGPHFLRAGCGYGGSCLPKDVLSLIHQMKHNKCTPRLLEAVDSVNFWQGYKIYDYIVALLGPPRRGKKITIWGLAFKAATDDLRDSPAIRLQMHLQEVGCDVVTYDPMGMGTDCDAQDAVTGADVLVVMTDADEFKKPNWDAIKKLMRQPNIVDGRNIYEPEEIRALGFTYKGIGQ